MLFQIKEVSDEIGVGVFTLKSFQKGDTVCFYKGEAIRHHEGLRRELLYTQEGRRHMYLYQTKVNGFW